MRKVALVIGIIALLSFEKVGALQQVRSQVIPSATPTLAHMAAPSAGAVPLVTNNLVPTPATVDDRAPQMSAREKAEVLVQEPDGSVRATLVAPGDVELYLRTIKQGQILTILPPESLMGPPPSPAASTCGMIQGQPSAPTPSPLAQPVH